MEQRTVDKYRGITVDVIILSYIQGYPDGVIMCDVTTADAQQEDSSSRTRTNV